MSGFDTRLHPHDRRGLFARKFGVARAAVEGLVKHGRDGKVETQGHVVHRVGSRLNTYKGGQLIAQHHVSDTSSVAHLIAGSNMSAAKAATARAGAAGARAGESGGEKQPYMARQRISPGSGGPSGGKLSPQSGGGSHIDKALATGRLVGRGGGGKSSFGSNLHRVTLDGEGPTQLTFDRRKDGTWHHTMTNTYGNTSFANPSTPLSSAQSKKLDALDMAAAKADVAALAKMPSQKARYELMKSHVAGGYFTGPTAPKGGKASPLSGRRDDFTPSGNPVKYPAKYDRKTGTFSSDEPKATPAELARLRGQIASAGTAAARRAGLSGNQFGGGKASPPSGVEAYEQMKATADALGLPWDDAAMKKQMGVTDALKAAKVASWRPESGTPTQPTSGGSHNPYSVGRGPKGNVRNVKQMSDAKFYAEHAKVMDEYPRDDEVVSTFKAEAAKRQAGKQSPMSAYRLKKARARLAPRAGEPGVRAALRKLDARLLSDPKVGAVTKARMVREADSLGDFPKALTGKVNCPHCGKATLASKERCAHCRKPIALAEALSPVAVSGRVR